jgi:hypothetical protein
MHSAGTTHPSIPAGPGAGAPHEPDTVHRVLEFLVAQGLDGVGPLMSSKDLAEKYRGKPGLAPEVRIERLIRTEARKTFGLGFFTGLGGWITVPVGVPVSIAGAGAFQSRMIGTIAELSGYDSSDPRVRSLTTLCLVSDTAADMLKAVGVRTAREALNRSSKRVLQRMARDILQRGAVRTSTRVGSAGVTTALKGFPVVGGAVGGTVDYRITKAIGKGAAQVFVPAP